ncbi:deleted in lung and esophageal cancer protein 1 isoform X2 [Salarias fasciatus]|uniref:deleted in lung and esophageal cancer protein 1 isoform X2 n=1 Tax=Salarias fasciatus TaxID=181472 RepID=UPI00117698D6|nr:deleted in lung and esophageal cancer protein 1 isoform X2 [Salarias fasciatus]
MWESPELSHIQFHLATDDVFHVSPSAGTLAPCQDREFLFTFCPKDLKEYHSVCHLVLRDVPQLPPEPSESSVLQPVQTGSKLRNVIVMEIEVKGSTEPFQILLEPYAVVIPGEVFICTTIRRKFKMWNHSRNSIMFEWEKLNSSSHFMEVEPSTGKIEENECFDFDLIVTGEKPESAVTSLVCRIEHQHEPVTLPVKVSFKGPTVTVSVPSVDFGLVRLGEQAQTTLLLSNPTQLEAFWELKERLYSPDSHPDSQISLEPCRGVLPPCASCCVDVVFKPRHCLQLETELELNVENGTGCHLSVRAVVQSPQVCLLSSELVFSELYAGVPAEGTVTLFNQTLLPSRFSWRTQLQGEQASMCTASFDPCSATLGPNASMEVTVHFTSQTDLEITDVAALCEVQGINSPLVVAIMAPKPKTLSVSYSLPSSGSLQDNRSPSPLVLDFGDVILKKAVTKQLLLTNQSAIAAPFTISAEYFTSCVSAQTNRSEGRFNYVKNPIHAVQAKKVEEKAYEEFVSSLLAHGKGAVFFVQPDTGTLKPFETQTVDVTAHTDMWGEYRDQLICKVGELDAVLIPMQMTVTGCPLYFQMTGRQTDDQRQGPIIHFGTHTSGGDTVSRSLRINNPTMFDVRVDWETYNIEPNDCKLLDVVVSYGDAFPLKDADGNETLSGALGLSGENVQSGWKKTHNSGCEETSSPLQSTTDLEEEEEFISEEEEEAYLYPSSAEKKLISVHIRPHMGTLSDYPYCITPQQIVIPSKSSGVIHVSFTPLTLSGSACETRCAGLAVGFMSLDHEMAACIPGKVKRSQGLDLEPVKMDLLAAVKPAALLVQMEEDDGALEFHATAGDLLRAGADKELLVQEFDTVRSFRLQNSSEMPLHFRLGTQSPFSVLKLQPRARTSTSSNPPTGDKQSLVLQPQHSMRVRVAFHCSLPLLDHGDQTDEQMPPGVTLTHSASGHKRLKFQQNLLIHYSNNTIQSVPLCALLDLSTLHLSCEKINFEVCCVGQTRTRQVNLCCSGAHTYWTSEFRGEDSTAFRMSPDFGLLRSKELHVSQNLQISFTPSEDREFRASVVIQSPLVKTPLTLQLTGTGSFDQVYRTEFMPS